MTDTITTIEPLTTGNKRKTYQKNYLKKYMREKYQANAEDGNAKQKSIRAKKKYGIKGENGDDYGIYLGHHAKFCEMAKFLKDKNPEKLREDFRKIMENEPIIFCI